MTMIDIRCNLKAYFLHILSNSVRRCSKEFKSYFQLESKHRWNLCFHLKSVAIPHEFNFVHPSVLTEEIFKRRGVQWDTSCIGNNTNLLSCKRYLFDAHFLYFRQKAWRILWETWSSWGCWRDKMGVPRAIGCGWMSDSLIIYYVFSWFTQSRCLLDTQIHSEVGHYQMFTMSTRCIVSK